METCFLALSFHNNKVFSTLDRCSLTLENLGSDPSENPEKATR